MSVLKGLRIWWHGFKTRRKMDRVFSRGEDPYHYADSPYERARLDGMQAALGPCETALEVGCAEGLFTERLAKLAKRITAVDISSVALERARKRCPEASFAEADLRVWSPPEGTSYDAIVLGDVLYYLDKPMVRDGFEATFPRVAGWLKPGGSLLLAHGFAGPKERAHREGFTKRFQDQGLTLISERVIGEGEADGKVCCLLSLLRR
ncbi:MAG: methyltransferase domain-containing protein [Elusimicrobia bacterium]|nr:methyltransferase domain-containing protein [Elusimicrobiota bacterium]